MFNQRRTHKEPNEQEEVTVELGLIILYFQYDIDVVIDRVNVSSVHCSYKQGRRKGGVQGGHRPLAL